MQTLEQPIEKAASSAEVLQLVGFRVGNEEFGLDILKVQEIIRFRDLTRVPNMPEFVEGVLNLRGDVIPVIALRRRFGMEPVDLDKRTRIVVAEVNGSILGFVVDEVSEVLRISADTVEPPPKLGHGGHDYVQGIGKLEGRLVILINLSALVSGADHAHTRLAEPKLGAPAAMAG
jgi:purine-binding chemotaxis protein CheW